MKKPERTTIKEYYLSKSLYNRPAELNEVYSEPYPLRDAILYQEDIKNLLQFMVDNRIASIQLKSGKKSDEVFVLARSIHVKTSTEYEDEMQRYRDHLIENRLKEIARMQDEITTLRTGNLS